MDFKAKTKHIRRSPIKIRRIAKRVMGMVVSDAVAFLEHLPNEGALNLKKIILSASANAVAKNADITTDQLIIHSLVVNQGPSLKRIKPRARGSADRICKRTSHVEVVLRDVVKESK